MANLLRIKVIDSGSPDARGWGMNGGNSVGLKNNTNTTFDHIAVKHEKRAPCCPQAGEMDGSMKKVKSNLLILYQV